MNSNLKWLQASGVFVLVVLATSLAIWLVTGKANNVNKFNLTSDKIVKDLDGKAVSLMLNQVWPFESSQNINLQII